MNGKHWVAFGVGVLVGWLVVPMAMGIFTKKAA